MKKVIEKKNSEIEKFKCELDIILTEMEKIRMIQ